MPGATEEYSEASSPKEGGKDSFCLPGDALGGMEFKAGDTITLKVVGHTSDGDVEVQHVKEDSQDAFDSHMDAKEPSEPAMAGGGGAPDEHDDASITA